MFFFPFYNILNVCGVFNIYGIKFFSKIKNNPNLFFTHALDIFKTSMCI